MIVLDLPMPPSVNRTRRIDWAAKAHRDVWVRVCDGLVLATPKQARQPISGQFQVTVTVSNTCRLDLDNGLKSILDYLVRCELVKDDGPRYCRRIILEWGEVSEGVRVRVSPFDRKQESGLAR